MIFVRHTHFEIVDTLNGRTHWEHMNVSALYVACEMFQIKYSMKNHMCGSISWIFVVHTIFQGLGERFRLRDHAEKHVISTRVEDQ